MTLIPVIMSGGAGARLWPVSREAVPKPFIRLADGFSLLQHAMKRAAMLDGASEVLTVTNRAMLFQSIDEYRALDLDVMTSFILEPEGRDTAAAIGVATLDVAARVGGDAIVCVLPADHMINDVNGFAEAVAKAVTLAENGRLVTFGITPDRAETGYGYIETNGSEVLRFVEKPDRQTAEQYLASGNFFWNAGMFCFRADVMIGLMRQHCPDILESCEVSLRKSTRVNGGNFYQMDLDRDAFADIRKTSIDYAVLEKADNVAVVPCQIGWSDIGSWTAFGDLVDPDQNGNRVDADAFMVNSRNTVIHGKGRLIGAVGLDNMVIVDTPDAVLVASRDHVQDVKALYNDLKLAGRGEHKQHRTEQRPWGSFTILDEGPAFKSKRIEVKPGGRLSLQAHKHRSEHWVVVSGIAHVVNGDNEFDLEPNESTYIPCGNRHRLENRSDQPVVLIEVQTGTYFGEDDIVRFEDTYGRS